MPDTSRCRYSFYNSKLNNHQEKSAQGPGPKSVLSKQTVPDVDEIIKCCIDTIWKKYDCDGKGYLDKEDCFAFVMESVKGAAADKWQGFTEDSDDDSDEEEKFREKFEELYAKIDTDNSNVIAKDEMLFFVKELIGL